jgi:hypothetical protein
MMGARLMDSSQGMGYREDFSDGGSDRDGTGREGHAIHPIGDQP